MLDGKPPHSGTSREASDQSVRPAAPTGGRKRRLLQLLISDTSAPTYRAAALTRRAGAGISDAWDLAKLFPRSDHGKSVARHPNSVVKVRYRGRPISASKQVSANVLSTQTAALQALCESATVAEVPIFGYLESSTTIRIATTNRHASRLLSALRTLTIKSGRPISLATIDSGRIRNLTDIQRFPLRLLDKHSILAVGAPVVDPLEQQVLGVTEAIQLEIWQEDAHGVLRAPGPNRWCDQLPTSAREPASLSFAGVVVPSFKSLTTKHVDDVDFDIDAVVTWVDDTDANWQARLAAHSGDEPRWAADQSRYRNLDELRYCLRSIRTYAPWIRRIHLVTDQQIPGWLLPNQDIQVVDHRELWSDPAALPVFNSHAIESRLHHIPGLASHYLYVNDDVFLGRTATPEQYFTAAGLARIFPSTLRIGIGPPKAGDGSPSIAARNDRSILKRAVGRVQTTKLLHTPIPQLRDVALELEQQFTSEYDRTARSRFRSSADISPISLQSWYGYATGSFVASDTTTRYYDLLTDNLKTRLRYLLKHRHIDSFCLNMGETIDQMSLSNAERVEAFLPRYFPFAPEWEHSESEQGSD